MQIRSALFAMILALTCVSFELRAMSCESELDEIKVSLVASKALGERPGRLLGWNGNAPADPLRVAILDPQDGVSFYAVPATGKELRSRLMQPPRAVVTRAVWAADGSVVTGDEFGVITKYAVNGELLKTRPGPREPLTIDADDKGLVAGYRNVPRVRISPVGGGTEMTESPTAGPVEAVRLHHTPDGRRWVAIRSATHLEVLDLTDGAPKLVNRQPFAVKAPSRVRWIDDEHGVSALVYNDQHSLWLYYPTRGTILRLIGDTISPDFSTLHTWDHHSYILVHGENSVNQLYRLHDRKLIALDRFPSAPQNAVEMLDLKDLGMVAIFVDPVSGHVVVRELSGSSAEPELKIDYELPLQEGERLVAVANRRLGDGEYWLALQTSRWLHILDLKFSAKLL